MKTILAFILVFSFCIASADKYTSIEHLDTIKGYMYTVDYDSIYYPSVDSVLVMPIKIIVRYNEFNWMYGYSDLFKWEMESRRQDRHKTKKKRYSDFVDYEILTK